MKGRSNNDDINYDEAKNYVKPFIKDRESLELWDRHFFKAIANNSEVFE